MKSPGADYLQEVKSVKAAGTKLIVHLKKRVPDFPARMTMPYLCPVPTALPIDPEGVPAPLAGSGPYYVAEFVRAKQVVLKRNPVYRASRSRHVDQLVVQVEDLQVVSRKVEAGEMDVDEAVPLFRLEELYRRY